MFSAGDIVKVIDPGDNFYTGRAIQQGDPFMLGALGTVLTYAQNDYGEDIVIVHIDSRNGNFEFYEGELELQGATGVVGRAGVAGPVGTQTNRTGANPQGPQVQPAMTAAPGHPDPYAQAAPGTKLLPPWAHTISGMVEKIFEAKFGDGDPQTVFEGAFSTIEEAEEHLNKLRNQPGLT